jgi:molybdopterin converting factor small subunit
MPFTIILPNDVAYRTGEAEIVVEAQTYEQAVWEIVNKYPACRDLLINSKDELRRTIRCTIGNEFLTWNTPIPTASKVRLVFAVSGG